MTIVNKYALSASSVLFDVCAGPDGNVWTCAYNDVVSKVTPAGVVTTYSGPSRAEGIIKGPDGNLWLTNALAGGAGKMTPGGAFTSYGGSGIDTYGICAGPDGNLWYTYGTSLAATHIEAVTTGGSAVISVSPSSATNLPSICTGPDGNLWVADTGNKLWQVTTAGVCTAVTLASHAPGTSRRTVCAGPDGNLWVAAGGLWQVTTGEEGVSDRTRPASRLRPEFVSPGGPAATYFAPSGVSANCVCAGPDGNLWVGDQTHHCVWQINTSGVVLAQIVLTGSTPNSICAGPDGNIWVLDNTYAAYAVWQVVLAVVVAVAGGIVVGSIVIGPSGPS
jgi:virginiamycin B lyase